MTLKKQTLNSLRELSSRDLDLLKNSIILIELERKWRYGKKYLECLKSHLMEAGFNLHETIEMIEARERLTIKDKLPICVLK